MTYSINETHDPNLRSWVESANDPNTDFPIQNLPLGLFDRHDYGSKRHIGIAIGDQVLDLTECCKANLLGIPENISWVFSDNLNKLMELDHAINLNIRGQAIALLREGSTIIQPYHNEHPDKISLLVPMSDTFPRIPAEIGDYTDFYASIFHATNIGKMFRPDNPLLPNYKHMPIGYHGRASSVVVSGTPIRRPCGQTKTDDEAAPKFGPSRVLDYEIELGLFVGQGNNLGEPVSIAEAEDYIFGLCLVNDWSARDLQRWEYQPLGPFLAKSFATSISPWIVTLEALAPFRLPAFARAEGDPELLPYLDSPTNRESGGFEINFDLYLSSEKMREQKLEPFKLVSTNAKNLYWTLAQMLTHHTSNGCNLRSGDLIASGTISGAQKNSYGSLMEFTWQGTQPIELPSGEVRKFLADGDEVILRGYCERTGFRRIGFGECRAIILPAKQ